MVSFGRTQPLLSQNTHNVRNDNVHYYFFFISIQWKTNIYFGLHSYLTFFSLCDIRCKWGSYAWCICIRMYMLSQTTSGSKVMSQSLINNNFLSTQRILRSRPNTNIHSKWARNSNLSSYTLFYSHSISLGHIYTCKWANLAIIYGSRLVNYLM